MKALPDSVTSAIKEAIGSAMYETFITDADAARLEAVIEAAKALRDAVHADHTGRVGTTVSHEECTSIYCAAARAFDAALGKVGEP